MQAGKYQKTFKKGVATAGIIVLLLVGTIHARAMNLLVVGNFSRFIPGKSLPDGWKPLAFRKIERHTGYTWIKVGDIGVIKAVSRESASGLIREMTIDPEKYPVIKWRWKVTGIYKKGDVTKKSGDDFPARIYITFAYNPKKVGFFERMKFSAIKLLYGEYPPGSAITYIWANKLPKQAVVDNPYTGRIKMIAVESGKENLNTWIDEKRNIYEDYIKAFGKKPPLISGVAIMTDSDNTGESTVSYYGDIVFEPAP